MHVITNWNRESEVVLSYNRDGHFRMIYQQCSKTCLENDLLSQQQQNKTKHKFVAVHCIMAF